MTDSFGGLCICLLIFLMNGHRLQQIANLSQWKLDYVNVSASSLETLFQLLCNNKVS